MTQRVPGQAAYGSYYPYIDGLRALAVLAVVIYHLQAAWLPGGFIGVDVFFVISGFIVSASIASYRADSFTAFLGFFYARRIKRIFPALIVCLLVTTFVSALFVPPSWLSGVNQQTGRYALLGLSNFILAGEGRNYFAPTTEFNPFTHTWSLAVEEQFYLVFPVMYLAWLGAANVRWRSPALFGAGALMSIVYATWLTPVDPTAAFFLTPSRFWQLASGVLLFQFISRMPPSTGQSQSVRPWRQGLAIASLILLLAGFGFSSSKLFPMPGALLPVLATAGLIYALHHHPELRGLHRLLGCAPLVGIGRLSYSLYLWHWPVFVLFRWTWGLDEPLQWAGALFIAFSLAWLSYRFVETPFRQSKVLRRLPSAGTVAGGLMVIGVSYWMANAIDAADTRISQSQVTARLNVWYPDGFPLDPASPGCTASPEVNVVGRGIVSSYVPRGCEDGRPLNSASLYVIGDSHALAYTSLFEQFAIRHATPVHVYNNGGCPFLSFQPERDMGKLACWRNTEAALADLRGRVKPGDVLFLPSLRLPRFADQWAYFGKYEVYRKVFGLKAIAGRTRAEAYAISVLKPLSDMDVQIVFEAPKPLFESPPFRCADWFNHNNPACAPGFDLQRSLLEGLRAPVLESYAHVAARVRHVQVWDPFPILCPGETCSAFDGQIPLFLDGDHLSGHGNMILVPDFSAFMVRLLGRYSAELEQGVALSKAGTPDFLESISGFSQVEPWGRWTDARLGPAKLRFTKPLPDAFTLYVEALAYGPNVGAPVAISAGGVVRHVTFGDSQKTLAIAFEGVRGDTIEFTPMQPVSPTTLGAGPDMRQLGLGVSSVKLKAGPAQGLPD